MTGEILSSRTYDQILLASARLDRIDDRLDSHRRFMTLLRSSSHESLQNGCLATPRRAQHVTKKHRPRNSALPAVLLAGSSDEQGRRRWDQRRGRRGRMRVTEVRQVGQRHFRFQQSSHAARRPCQLIRSFGFEQINVLATHDH